MPNHTSSFIREMLFSPYRVRAQSASACQAKEVSTQTAAAGCGEDICAVCLELPGVKNVSITSCGHRFCTSCLLSSLRTKNTCPTCRAEIEPSRNTVLQPLTATVAAEIIQSEERDIDIARRISLINAFTDTNGRAGMIISLCRELAFGAAHSLAGWQGTSEETYHSSWREYEYNDYNSDSDSDSDTDDSGSESGSESGSGSESHETETQTQRLDDEPESNESDTQCASSETTTDPAEAQNEVVSEPRIVETETEPDADTELRMPRIVEVENGNNGNDSVVYASLVIRAAVTSVTYLMVVTLASVVVNVMSVIE